MSEFALYLRAARLGYGKARFGWMRASPVSSDPLVIRFDFVPASGPISTARDGASDNHYCWWDSPEDLNTSPFLRQLKRVRNRFSVLIGEDGEAIKELSQ